VSAVRTVSPGATGYGFSGRDLFVYRRLAFDRKSIYPLERELSCCPSDGEIVSDSAINCTILMNLVIAATEIRKSPMLAP
jgi:hypothetical protein